MDKKNSEGSTKISSNFRRNTKSLILEKGPIDGALTIFASKIIQMPISDKIRNRISRYNPEWQEYLEKALAKNETSGEKIKNFVIELSKQSLSIDQIAKKVFRYDDVLIDYMVDVASSIGDKELSSDLELSKSINNYKRAATFKLAYADGILEDYMALLSDERMMNIAEELCVAGDELGIICSQIIFTELENRSFEGNKSFEENKSNAKLTYSA